MPYFLPMPLPLFGTLGAFIRIREPFRSKRELFDIGVAGPLAGFAVLVPVLFAGLLLSNVVRVPTELKGGVLLGEPLLFKAATWLVWGPIADGYTVNLHPMAFAAWFGMLATALNLFPIGQLDGGHISYAVLGRRSHIVTLATVGCAMVLTYFSSSWFLWTSLVVVMLFVFGSRHPRTADEASPLTRGRLALAFLALIVLALCFTPAPLEIIDLLPR
jgi:membrane-associated protease RseP (regulator of RpoE activity)